MAEKGGKGFSLPPKGGKSSIKSSPLKEASIKGKDDSSTKKKGRKVQFDSEAVNFSSKSGGKDSPTTFPKGKGDKGASGGKGSVSKVPQPLELRIEQELPKNAKCLMACEAAEILEGIQDRMTTLSKDPSIKIPVTIPFCLFLDHLTRDCSMPKEAAIIQILNLSEDLSSILNCSTLCLRII
ncbi:DNA-directed RNA polymerases IV and V subunit 4 isoform X2 [Ziziphus jujuba]|uniref:DNA-directed RNA polymerases IV and V subunit 4 isoform X2 n=1 Tax=Ziziphus jujuba TaxID=326968 RepID=A0ABM4A8M4_ZIZJJ|nr:DNA-directed RNA polymerases IV and V subunit 4 isoform X2 [Ziziphus jujuba]